MSPAEEEIEPLRIGIIGCGTISTVYLRNAMAWPELDVRMVADLDPVRARARGDEFGVPWARSVGELLAADAIEAAVNLTVPLAHAEVSTAILAAGKHLYSEKPLATTREDGRCLLQDAARRGLLVGCAPDTFFGSGLSTARAVVDSGTVGLPIAATAFFLHGGQETWHPNPAFFFQPGGGPLFDFGPYYLTALITMLGPVRQVSAMARASFPRRTITSKPLAGTIIDVTTPTHISGELQFDGGPIATLLMSFDVSIHGLPYIEVYGSNGTVQVPDPNTFRGPVRVRRGGSPEWQEIQPAAPSSENLRGLGLLDLARAIREGGTPRASGALAYHVLDVMCSLLESAADGRHVTIESTCDRPEPVELQIGAPAG